MATGPDTSKVASVNDPEYSQGANVAWLVHDGVQEFIAFQTVVTETDQLTLSVIARGCLDTAPSAFPSGTRVWFISYASKVLNVVDDESTEITFQPYNNSDAQSIETCPSETVSPTTPARSDRVYCPTAVTFNGVSYPSTITGELTVTWAHRNRLDEVNGHGFGEGELLQQIDAGPAHGFVQDGGHDPAVGDAVPAPHVAGNSHPGIYAVVVREKFHLQTGSIYRAAGKAVVRVGVGQFLQGFEWCRHHLT